MPPETSQVFYLLQRQVLDSYRKPLVIFMSRCLLRLKGTTSPLEDFTEGSTFHPVIGDIAERTSSDSAKRVALYASQVYCDLEAGRAECELEDDVAIVRVEQLYPFPHEEVRAELTKRPSAKSMVRIQEESKNQGAFYQIRHRTEGVISEEQKPSYAGRPSSTSPAVGYLSKYIAQLKQLVEDALAL